MKSAYIEFELLQYLHGNSNQNRSTRMGFEPTRAEPNGLAVHRLNHSATSSCEDSELHELYQFKIYTKWCEISKLTL